LLLNVTLAPDPSSGSFQAEVAIPSRRKKGEKTDQVDFSFFSKKKRATKNRKIEMDHLRNGSETLGRLLIHRKSVYLPPTASSFLIASPLVLLSL